MSLQHARGSFAFDVRIDNLRQFFSRPNHYETPLFPPGWKLFMTHELHDPLAIDSTPTSVRVAVNVRGMSNHLWGDVSVILEISPPGSIGAISKTMSFQLNGRPQPELLPEAVTFARQWLWDNNAATRQNNHFLVNVRFSFAPDCIPVPMKPALLKTLTSTLNGQEMNDTMFVLFSRISRDTKRVYHPRPVYARSGLLHTKGGYLDIRTPGPPSFIVHSSHSSQSPKVLETSGFSESIPINIQNFALKSGDEFTDEYDYFSDSDLEDDSDADPMDEDSHRSFMKPSGSGLPAGVTKVVLVKDAALTTYVPFVIYFHGSQIVS